MSTEEQSKKDLYYMQRALAEAEAAYKEGEIPVGAVVVCRDRIIARAHNLTETLNDVTAHAEMQAITMAANELGGKYLQELTVYVTVEPCIMCAGAIGWAQLRRIVYGCPDEKRGYHEYAPKAFHPKAKCYLRCNGRGMSSLDAAILSRKKVGIEELRSERE